MLYFWFLVFGFHYFGILVKCDYFTTVTTYIFAYIMFMALFEGVNVATNKALCEGSIMYILFFAVQLSS